MKGLICLVLVIGGVVTEPPAPYAPSGWRPSGPAFVLPSRGQPTKNQEYLPPPDPRNPAVPNPEYGAPDDVSVQGLPTQEQEPIFQTSPINGQQYLGPAFNYDIKNLNQNQRQTQFQQQQEIYQKLERLRQLEAAQPNTKSNLPYPQNPRQFASRTTPKSKPTPEPTTETPMKQVTEANLNEREILEDDSAPAKLRTTTTVEITKQNIQQYPGELFLSSLAQLQLQPQFVPLQQIRASYVQAQITPKQIGYDAPVHFAALPSVLAQQKVAEKPLIQNPQLLIGEQQATQGYVTPQAVEYQPTISYQPQLQYQQPQAVEQGYIPPSQDAFAVQSAQFQPALQPQGVEQSYIPPSQDAFAVQSAQFQPALQPQGVEQSYMQPYQNAFAVQSAQFQPALQPQGVEQGYIPPNSQSVTQIQAQRVIFQPQPIQVGQVQPNDEYDQKNKADNDDYQNQQGYQPTQLYQQPILVPAKPLSQAPQLFSAQLVNQEQFYQGQYQPQLFQNAPQQYQTQDALQSGLDVSNEGNDIDQAEDKDSEEDDAPRTTAVATAFGARTQPRVFTQYGAPYPAPRAQANPTTTESGVEEVTENPDVAEAVAVSTGIRKRNGKLRNRRILPVIGVDRSGRLVLAAE